MPSKTSTLRGLTKSRPTIHRKTKKKIAPVVEEQIATGEISDSVKKKKPPAFDIRLGLLKVRISLKIEPQTGV